jgi:replicative DNA helicase
MALTADDLARVRSERVPPQNLAAEESVLGSLMLSEDAIADVVERIKPEDFYRAAHRKIYEAAIAIYTRGDPVDAITVVEELKRGGSLESIGGHLRIHELVENVPTPASAGYYARIVSELALLRRLISAAADIMELGYGQRDEPSEIADAAEEMIYRVSRHAEKDEAVSMARLVDAAVSDLERIEQQDSAFAGIPTRFTDLDKLTAGLQNGNLIVVAARPGVGKSSFVTNVARNIAVDAGKTVALFSLEMSRWEIGMRMLCGEARVPWDRIRTGRPSADDWQRIGQAAETLHTAPFYVVDSGNVNITEIRAKARRMRSSKDGLHCIMVDYLQLMSHHGRVENRQQEIADISRNLKLLAKELDIPVIAVSQLNRDPERRADKRPQLSDLRESGAIEQDADLVMFIHREDSEDPSIKGTATLILAKHRNGPTGDVKLTFLPQYTQFRNYSPGP